MSLCKRAIAVEAANKMSDAKFHNRINETIHQRTRLAIMASLAGVDKLDFNELKAELGLTDGNLSTHLSSLERAGYVTIEKTFKGKKPHTSLVINGKGRAALANYIRLLQGILDQARPK
jgi:DNA-binding transcriptional ArsR family regulator